VTEFERTIILTWRKTRVALKEQAGDVHTRIMKRNYEQVPDLWFISILFLMTIIALLCCEGFNKQLQLPWWGVLLSLTIALVFTLPIGVIQATTNQVLFCFLEYFESNTSRKKKVVPWEGVS
jgi:membrane protein required for beta-lactamase induction